MATLYIAEFSNLVKVGFGPVQIPLTPALAEQTVAIAGVSAQSAAFNAGTHIIRVHTDAICSVEIGGTSPTATTTSPRMAANQTEYFGVSPGDKIAVITNS